MGLINAIKPTTAGGYPHGATTYSSYGAGGKPGTASGAYGGNYHTSNGSYGSSYGNQNQQYAYGGRDEAAEFTSTYGKGNRYTTQNSAIVQERIIQHQVEEVQPVIDREREETQVRVVVQPIHDLRHETHHHEASHPPVSRETIEDLNPEHVRRYLSLRNAHQPGRTIEEPTRTQNVSAPIIHEVIKPHIIEEIQPVIHREIRQTHVIHRHQPIYERHVAAPKVLESTTLEPISLDEFQKRGGTLTGTEIQYGGAYGNGGGNYGRGSRY
ncbi:hypothetical protein HK097_008617 [Rhizophlyctis rosea]|uniref:Uncharacterized protein n=1 Tax=Rhizophlyctis rosea TaxID=64517 RepID=A0AAD5SC76_9FUNG|nr:hypothetical protein HK097_008617 [Rhizophlyctis rosea]